MYAQIFLVTSVRGIGELPTTAASAGLGVIAFMNAALGLRFAPAFFFFLAGAFFFAAVAFLAAFFAVFFTAFFAVFFTAFFAVFFAAFFAVFFAAFFAGAFFFAAVFFFAGAFFFAVFFFAAAISKSPVGCQIKRRSRKQNSHSSCRIRHADQRMHSDSGVVNTFQRENAQLYAHGFTAEGGPNNLSETISSSHFFSVYPADRNKDYACAGNCVAN
jgi:hypothetical protein